MVARTDRQPASSGPNATVGVILVNYCTGDLTIQCLDALEAELKPYPGSRIVVVDNDSPDGSGSQIAAAITARGWSDWAELLQMTRNGGFSFGNNAGIRHLFDRGLGPRYLWLLNTDTIVREGALKALVTFMDAHPDAGICGSRLEDPDTTLQCSAFRFHTIAGEFESNLQVGAVSRALAPWVIAPPHPDHAAPYDWVSGASMLIRRSVIEDVGPLDEGFFLYYEETDYCRRASQKGWSCWYVPESRVVHLVGRSTGVTSRTSLTKRRPTYWFQSRRRYFLKHHGIVYAIAADASLAMATALSLMRDWLRGKSRRTPEKLVYDLVRQSAVLHPSLDGPR